jgi:hypothetical protein
LNGGERFVNDTPARQSGVAAETVSDQLDRSDAEFDPANRKVTIPTFSVPVSDEDVEKLRSAFFHEGCIIITRVFTSEETATHRAKTDMYASDHATPAKHISYAGSTLVLRRCHEMDPLFESLITKDAIKTIAGRAGTSGTVQRHECDPERVRSSHFQMAFRRRGGVSIATLDSPF